MVTPPKGGGLMKNTPSAASPACRKRRLMGDYWGLCLPACLPCVETGNAPVAARSGG